MIAFLQAHRTVARLLQRSPLRGWVHRRVWAELESDADFLRGMERGLADISAGRLYRTEMRNGVRWSVPNPDWPAEGPQPHEARPMFARDRSA